MNTAAYLLFAALVATALYFGIRWLVTAFSKVRGSKVVTCPETGKPTIVEVDAVHATLTSAFGHPDIRLQECARWPIKRDCGQECLLDLDVAPSDCLVSGVLMRWYKGKTCVYCHKAFEEIHWVDHRPALRTPDGKLLEWRKVAAADVPTVMQTHFPVCWDCYITQSFSREHPELVVYRNSKSQDSDLRPQVQ